MAAMTAISVVVRDMGASLRFYQSLGLEVEAGDASSPHANFVGQGTRLMLDTEELIRQLHPDWTRPTGGHAIALAFECETPAEVDATYQRLVAAGAPSKDEPFDAFWGQRYATVLDPDGNLVDLFCDL